jgi:hypothetical protein
MSSRLIGKRKPSKFTIAALGSLFAVAAVYMMVTIHAAPSGSNLANAWVDPNGGTCTYHAQAAAWVDGEGCTSIDQALGKVTNGDTVRIKASTGYGAQTTTSNKTSTTYVIAENGTIIGNFSPKANYVEYQNFTAGNMDLEDVDAQHVTLRNVNLSAQGHITIDGPDNFSWIGGNIGAYQIQTTDWPGRVQVQGCNPNCGDSPTTHILFDGLNFAPTTRSAGSIAAGNHTEIIRLNQGVTDFTVRNSTFQNGSDVNSSSIFMGTVNGTQTETNLTFENNFFGTSGASGYTFNTNGGGGACTTWLIQYNTVPSDSLFPGGAANCTSQSNITIRGNLGRLNSSSCGNAIFDNNVWTNSLNCGGGDLSGQSLSFIGDGFHIPSSSPARGNGSATVCPLTDHDGDARPSANCDAGADQYSTGTNPPPPPTCTRVADINCDGLVNIQDVTVVLSNFGKPASQATDPRADSSGNGSVDIPDLTVVLSAFGS